MALFHQIPAACQLEVGQLGLWVSLATGHLSLVNSAFLILLNVI